MTPGQRAVLAQEVIDQRDEDEMTDEEWFWDHYGHAEKEWEQ